jgi:hypothetical protein
MHKRDDVIRVLITDPVLQKRLAKYLVHRCFRNSVLEDLHAGIAPDSKAGDYSDVLVTIGLASRFADEPTKKAQWQGFFRKSRLGTSAELSEVVAALSSFLGPVAKALSSQEGFRRKWVAPGPWTDR